jgi:uncharacterized protein YndB with AHSA1/START domain
MLTIIAIAVVALIILVVAILAIAATRPDALAVERATRINAPPENIFILINDFRSWASWSPYEKKDPAMKRTYSGAASGKGAVYEWMGNGNVGQGRMEIADIAPSSRVTINLDFIKPFEGHNIAEFALHAEDGGTHVVWAMRGRMHFIAKVMSLFLNMDKMIGDDFEAGLANMKAIAEK